MTVKVNTMWEIHSHHTRVPCKCGGEYAFDLAAIGEWTAERKTEKFISKCSDCGDRVLTEFDITDRSQEMDDVDRMLMKKWPPASSGPYPMGSRGFPKFETEGIKTFSIMGHWHLIGASQGSMSKVYLCAHRGDPRSLAVAKLPISPGGNEDHVRECQLLLLLNFAKRSPHVVRLLEVEARPGGVPVWLLESVLPGPRGCVTLADWISEYRNELESLPVRQWIGQIATGLLHCGELVEGFAHADLKPDNILVAEGWICKIADFGLAGWKDRAATPGAPLYQAPELANGVRPNASSDIFSLGVIAYELFTGRNPWEAASRASIDRLKIAMRSGVVNADPSVPLIVLQCLEVDPAKRPTLLEIQQAFMFPEVRTSLVEAGEGAFAVFSQGLIALGMPDVVVKTMADGSASRNAATRVNIAVAFSQTGSHDFAEVQYAQLASEGIDVVAQRAVNDQRRGLHEASLNALRPLIAKSPNDVGLRINASAACNDLGLHSEALELLEQARASDPGNPTVLYQYAYTLIALRKCSKAKDAVDKYKKVAGETLLWQRLEATVRACCPGLYKSR